MDRKSPFLVEFGHSVNGIPRYVHQTPFYLVADRHRDGRTVRNGFHSSLQSVCRIHRYGTDRVFPNMLLDFHNQDFSIGAGYLHCVVDAGKCYLFFLVIIEMDVHDRTDNLWDITFYFSHTISFFLNPIQIFSCNITNYEFPKTGNITFWVFLYLVKYSTNFNLF